MVREFWLRPSLAVGGATILIVVTCVLRGDLRLRRDPVLASPHDNADLPTGEPGAPIVLRRSDPLPPVATVLRRGRVFDAAGFLLVGAEVVPAVGAAIRTDADGAFVLPVPVKGLADALVRAAGRSSVRLRLCAESPADLVVALAPAAPWDAPVPPVPPPPALRGEGEVLDIDGRPLAHAFVGAAGSGLWARTDEAGRFALLLPSASSQLFVHAPSTAGNGLAAAAVSFASGRERGAVPVPPLQVEPALQLRGIVRDESGRPLAGLPVRVAGELAEHTCTTGPGGDFRVAGLMAGTYTVAPFASRGAVVPQQAVTLVDRPCDIDLQLRPMQDQTLHVVDASGRAAARVFVASAIAGMRRGIGQTDDEGRVSLPVWPEAEFDVRSGDAFEVIAVDHFDDVKGELVLARQ
jgi:hypothetical protein